MKRARRIAIAESATLAGKKGTMMRELRKKATNFRVVKLPAGVHASILTLFRRLP